MAFFKVTFSRWFNEDEPAMETASSIAEELTAYKNTMSDAFEGLAMVESLVEIPLSETANLDRLSIYKRYRHSR